MRSVDFVAATAGDASADVAGASMDARQLIACSVQVLMTGTASGTVKLQFSNDITNPIEPKGAAPTNWIDIPNATVTITGTAGVFGIAKTELCYQAIRAYYTKNNGSAGTCTITMHANGW